MKDVGTRVLQMFIDKAEREGLSWKSRQNVIKTLVSMWETARACDYVQPDNNPFRGLVLGDRGLVNVFSLSIEEIRRIVTAAPEPYRTFYWIIAETGIRCGEGCGLPISNIDIDNRVLYIRQKVWRGKIEPVKSKKGNRSFDISPQLAEHLRQFLESWRPNASGLLFATGKGTPWDPDTVRQRKFHPLLKKLKIQQCGFHAFRHGNATVLDKLHTPMALRQERLGHEDPKTTMGYTHVVTEDGRRIAEELGKLLAPSELRPAVMQSAGTA